MCKSQADHWEVKSVMATLCLEDSLLLYSTCFLWLLYPFHLHLLQWFLSLGGDDTNEFFSRLCLKSCTSNKIYLRVLLGKLTIPYDSCFDLSSMFNKGHSIFFCLACSAHNCVYIRHSFSFEILSPFCMLFPIRLFCVNSFKKIIHTPNKV